MEPFMSTTESTFTVIAEATPNPQTLRFMIGQEITSTPTEYKSAQQTITSPLAKKLFGFPWTETVFIGRDFVAVTKQEWVDWETLSEPLSGLIQEHLERGEGVIHQSASGSDTGANDSEDVRRIKQVLDLEIRPMVAQDGGDVAFHKFENGIVYLYMQGACAGCPSATMTLKIGIEGRLKEAVPSVQEVVAL
jgi:Fe-S cluster biogenesis protein NfuA